MGKKSAKAIKAARFARPAKAREAKLEKQKEMDARLGAGQASTIPLRISVVERDESFWEGRRQGVRQGYEHALLDAQRILSDAQARLLELGFASSGKL